MTTLSPTTRIAARLGRVRAALSAFALLALLAACATGPRVSTDMDPQADFARYRTYGFYQPLAMEQSGYTFEAADASFRLLVAKHTGQAKEFFSVETYRVIIERHTPEISARGELDLGDRARVFPSDQALKRLKELMPQAEPTVVYGEG